MDAQRPLNQQKSPSNRPALKTLNEDLNDSLLILSSSNDSKRDELNQLYNDMKLTADRLRADLEQEHQQTVVVNRAESDLESSPLKRVHFEDDEDENIQTNIQNTTLNTTYTVEKFIEAKTMTTNTSTTDRNVTMSAKSIRSRLPVKRINQSHKTTPDNNRTVQVVGTRIVTRTSKSPTNNRKKVLSYQQRKTLMLEAKEKLEKDLAIFRQKIILRKFAHIWLRKYFYSKNSLKHGEKLLLPSQLEHLRTRKLLTRSFKEWHSNVKFIRNEWRFNVKADCHYNYVLKNKIWDIWKEFVVEEKAEKKENNLALVHYKSKLIRACFEQWKQARIDFRKKETNLAHVRNLREQEISKEYFNLWYNKLLFKKSLEKMNEIADKHNEIYQLNKCFTIWYFKFNTEKEERRKIRIAKQHYRLRLLQKCIHSFQLYLINRRHKKVQKQKLAEYADSQLIYRTFHTWLEKYNDRKRLNDMHDELVQIESRFLIRRVFNYWKSAREFCVKIRVKEIRARKFYEKKLKEKSFAALKQNNDERRAEVARCIQAEKFDIFWTKRLYFEVWSGKLEEKRDINQMHLVYKAKKHHEIKLVSNCIKSWKSYILMQRDLKLKMKKADAFYARKTLKTYLDVMRYYVKVTKYKRHNHLIAAEIYKRNTWEKYFSLWYQNYMISIETQMNTRIAILHDQAKTMEKVFFKWHLKYNEKLKEELNEVRAIDLYKKSLLKNSLKIWVEFYRKNKNQINQETLAIKHDLKRLCSPIFDRWKAAFAQRQAIKQRCLDSSAHYERSLKRRLFTAWREETKTLHEINLYVDEAFARKQKSRLVELWNLWREQVSESRLERTKENLALVFYSKRLISRVITEWRGYITRRRLKQDNDEILISDCKYITGVIIKRHFFHVWLKKSQDKGADESKAQLALTFYQKKLKNRAYAEWRMFTIECARQKMREKQADLFLEMRLKTEVYFKWCIRYKEECEMREKNISALLMWSINVQKKYFAAWCDWHRQKKAKSNRYKQALEDRQVDIMRECGRKFLTYTWDSKQRRFESTRLLREQFKADELSLQEKYFRIWRTICEKKRPRQPPSLSCAALKPFVRSNNIKSNFSMEKREKVTKSVNPDEHVTKATLLNERRPAPRKPAHLLESIDVSAPSPAQTLQPPILSLSKSQVKSPIQPPKTVLLPPSAFTIIPSSTFMEHTYQTNDDEMNAKRAGSVGSDIVAGASKTAAKKQRRESNDDNTNITNEIELIEIKRRLEDLSIKSEKLKRLKEEERLLLNCIKSNGSSNTSMIETISKEKDQVQLEIEELTRFLKTEKHQINELLKKYKIT